MVVWAEGMVEAVVMAGAQVARGVVVGWEEAAVARGAREVTDMAWWPAPKWGLASLQQ